MESVFSISFQFSRNGTHLNCQILRKNISQVLIHLSNANSIACTDSPYVIPFRNEQNKKFCTDPAGVM